MAQVTSVNPSVEATHKQETTFKNYNASDAAKYAAHRPSYNPKLIELIMKTHTSTGGQTDYVIDIGCGTGIATRQIAAHFQHVYGVDAGASMIEQAQSTPCFSATGEQATFSICNSEDLDKQFEPESIDLITVATAAHWFDMPRFYTAAAKVLKPGGSIAMWCGGSLYTYPDTPNREQVQKLWNELELDILQPYEMPGNRLTRDLYKDLDMPWTIDTSASTVSSEMKNALSSFDEAASSRMEFNKDGKPDLGPEFAETKGFMNFRGKLTLERAGKAIGTASQVTRWRQAHKEQLEKGEIEDCVDRMVRLTREELAKVPEGIGRDWLELGVSSVLIVVKKKQT